MASAPDLSPTFWCRTAYRNTTASLAISTDANVKAVRRLLGHADATMTFDGYPKLFDDVLTGVVATTLGKPVESTAVFARSEEPWEIS